MGQRKTWSQQQDNFLTHQVKLNFLSSISSSNQLQRQKLTWGDIAQILNTHFTNITRTGKQCRQRWHNQLDPQISKLQWSNQQQQLLFQLQKHHGNKWALISSNLPGRTDNNVKNYFYSTLRKSFRKLNSFISIHKNQLKYIKQFNSSCLSKLLAVADHKFDKKINIKSNQVENNAIQIKNLLIQIIRIQPNTNNGKDIKIYKEIVQKLQEFNKNCKKKKGKRKQYIQKEKYNEDDIQINLNDEDLIDNDQNNEKNYINYGENNQGNKNNIKKIQYNYVNKKSSFQTVVIKQDKTKLKIDKLQKQHEKQSKQSKQSKKLRKNKIIQKNSKLIPHEKQPSLSKPNQKSTKNKQNNQKPNPISRQLQKSHQRLNLQISYNSGFQQLSDRNMGISSQFGSGPRKQLNISVMFAPDEKNPFIQDLPQLNSQSKKDKQFNNLIISNNKDNNNNNNNFIHSANFSSQPNFPSFNPNTSLNLSSLYLNKKNASTLSSQNYLAFQQQNDDVPLILFQKRGSSIGGGKDFSELLESSYKYDKLFKKNIGMKKQSIYDGENIMDK